MYMPEVHTYQTQLLLQPHSYQSADTEKFTNPAGHINYGYPDPYPNIYDGEING